MSKVLVTGNRGLLGSACEALFMEKGWEVVGVDNNNRARTLGTPAKDGEDFDIRNEPEVYALFEKHQFDAVIHSAAQPSHDYSNDHVLEDFDTNARATVILLEATRKFCPKATFVYISTDKVYGENMNMASQFLKEGETRYFTDWAGLRDGWKETLGLDYAGHRSPFGCSKAAGDMYAQEYSHTFGLKVGIFRPGCITGKNHEGAELHGFLAYLAKCIRLEKPYRVFGFKGKQVRDQIHSSDLANAIWHFVANPRQCEVYNIGGGPERSVSVLEAIQMIELEVGKKAVTEFAEARPGDRIWDIHDVSKFRSHYPEWDYHYSLADIIRDICTKEL